MTESKVPDFISIETSLKKQEITDMFFLPKESTLKVDCIALLNQSISIPYIATKETTKKITLSQIGFYLLLFKLSVHYCRFHEGVDRS